MMHKKRYIITDEYTLTAEEYHTIIDTVTHIQNYLLPQLERSHLTSEIDRHLDVIYDVFI